MEKIIRQNIISVDKNSPADKAKIVAGEILISINREPVVDLVDYEFLTASSKLDILVEDGLGQQRSVNIRKDETEPLGLNFETSLMSEMRTCQNRCIFCFVDQMPKGLRPTLSVKDDDWRMSFIMGNYVTLTNVPDEEFDRLIKRRVGPVYVSVHATDPEVRRQMMRNKTAGTILERLKKLKDAGLYFHAQIVACPGINDGTVLENTLNDLKDLFPACRSVAVIPVGLTKYRENLYELRGYTAEEAGKMIDTLKPFQEQCRKELDTTLVYLSDEWYLMAGRELPEYSHYEGFEQIENGVGLLRLFEDDFDYALEDKEPRKEKLHVSLAGGWGCRDFFAPLMKRLAEYNIEVDQYPIRNDFFGGNVTVAGLVTGQDLISQLKGKLRTETLLIPKNMLREQEDVFLDNTKLDELEKELNVKIRTFRDGEEFVEILFGDIK